MTTARSILLATLLAAIGCASEPVAKPAAMPEPEQANARDATELVTPRQATAMPPAAANGASATAGGGKSSGGAGGGGNGVGSGSGSGGTGAGSGSGSGRGGAGGTGNGGSGGGSGSGSSGGASGGSAGGGAASQGGSGASGAQGAGGASGASGGSSGGGSASGAAGGTGGSAGSAAGGASGGSAGGSGGAGASSSSASSSGGSSGAGSAGGGAGAAGASGASGASGAQGANGNSGAAGGAQGGNSSASGASGGAQGSASASGNARANGSSGAGAKGGGGSGGGSSGGSQDHLVAIGSGGGNASPARVPATAHGSTVATPGDLSGPRANGTKANTPSAQPAPTTGGVVRASAFGGDDADRIPDAAGQSSRPSNPRGKPDASGVVRGSSLDNGSRDATTDDRGEGNTSGSSRGEGERGANRGDARAPETLEVPDAHGDAGDPLDSTPAQLEDTTSPLRALHAHWQQVAESGNDADFGPGGFDLSLLSIRPTQKSLALHRAWGDPTLQQVGGEFRAEFMPEGTLRLSPAPAAPSRFDAKPIPLPAQAGRPARTISPPARALPLDTNWKLESPDLLRLDGRLYRRIDERAFEQLRRGNAQAPTDLATRASRARDPKARAEPAGGVDFFGARAEGTHICFVCDISGSMDGPKLDALRAELKRSIGALPRGSHVQVVFFSQVGHILTPGWKTTGTPACDALLRGIDRTGSRGGTDPTQAIEYAFTQLDPRPDTLFLLTDGQFDADVAGQLARLNPPTDQTRVHTIGLGGDVLGPALQAIAAANGGTYVHVPATGP